MADRGLEACRILVVEDEYLLAEELALGLTEAGASVLGPVPDVEGAFALLDDDALPTAAILDVNLGGESVFPLADDLIGRRVPVIFTTGYDPATLPSRFAHIATCEKPFRSSKVLEVVRNSIG